jgi:hypothetical protein
MRLQYVGHLSAFREGAALRMCARIVRQRRLCQCPREVRAGSRLTKRSASSTISGANLRGIMPTQSSIAREETRWPRDSIRHNSEVGIIRRKWSGNCKTVLGTVQADVACSFSFQIIHRIRLRRHATRREDRFDSNPNQTIAVFSTDRININVSTIDSTTSEIYTSSCK